MGEQDPKFLKTQHFSIGFDKIQIPRELLSPRVKMLTVNPETGELKEKRHAPRQKELVIALGKENAVSVFYVRDGQTISIPDLRKKAIEVAGADLQSLVFGSIFPRQKHWEHALHMISIDSAEQLNQHNRVELIPPQALVDFTLAQRLLHTLSAERLEIVRRAFKN